jgi:3-oxoacyl-[acyl-carrier protein] reductase
MFAARASGRSEGEMDVATARALVTGGSHGIGLETARLLRDRGAKVAICARDERRLRTAAKEIGAVPIPADVSVEDDVRRLVETTVRELGGYDVLVNNAAIGSFTPLLETDTEDFEAVLRTNLTGAMMVARASARHFVKERRGTIVNVGSTAAQRGFADGGAYCASKFGLSALTECWRAELRTHDVRVLQIDPSEVQTGFSGGRVGTNPRKLVATDIAHAIVAMLAFPDRGMITRLTVWATNPE